MSWLTDHRLSKKLTQEQMCDLLEITRPTYVKLEANPTKLTLGQIARLNTVGINVTIENFSAVDCPACDGSGILYKPNKGE